MAHTNQKNTITNGLKKRISIQGCRKDMHFEIALVNGYPFGIAMFAIDLGDSIWFVGKRLWNHYGVLYSSQIPEKRIRNFI